MNTLDIGNGGEQAAQKYLASSGLKFIEANHRVLGGEIDLIMKDEKENEYVFVEVRTRSSAEFGKAEESLSPHKQRALKRSIVAYMQNLPWNTQYRCDLVTVTLKNADWTIKHHKYIELR